MGADGRGWETVVGLLAAIFLVSLGVVPVRAQDQEAGPAPSQIDLPANAAPQPAADFMGGRAGTNYVIGAEDVLDIEVFNVPELKQTVRVANDGSIVLPLVGNVQAAGLTAQQLRQELETQYGKTYLENPQISVFIREFHAQPVSVIGAVERPGLYQITGPRNLMEVLSMAGGLGKRSSAPAGRTLLITRQGGFGDMHFAEGMHQVASDKLEIDLNKLLYSRDDALNIEVKPLDIISVSKAEVVYVVGEVKKPGGFVLENRETVSVLQALAMAEGMTGNAAKNAARIIRNSADGSRIEIPLDLSKILKGRSNDPQLAANDIVFVPTSTGKAAAKRGAEAAIGTISGILIYRH